jgi:hypothetical protein
MYAKIKPINLFKFGVADTLLLQSNQDDLSTRAQFFWQLGRTVPGTPAVAAVDAVKDADGNTVTPAVDAVPAVPDRFVGADGVIGNVTIEGDGYKGWDGSNDAALKFCLPQIEGSLELA